MYIAIVNLYQNFSKYRLRNIRIFAVVVLLLLTQGCKTGIEGKPLIGITSNLNTSDNNDLFAGWIATNCSYIQAVRDAGGVPVIIPVMDDNSILASYCDMLDGLVIIGGADVPPEAYGQIPNSTIQSMNSRQYQMERKLIGKWLAGGKPILGICLGMQISNVVSGGTLIQDIPSQTQSEIEHRGNGKKAMHMVYIDPNSVLFQILECREAMVFSSHHQAVDVIGKNLHVSSLSADGLIESIERDGQAFGIFVQWHPESMDDSDHRNRLYGAFVQACKGIKNDFK